MYKHRARQLNMHRSFFRVIVLMMFSVCNKDVVCLEEKMKGSATVYSMLLCSGSSISPKPQRLMLSIPRVIL